MNEPSLTDNHSRSEAGTDYLLPLSPFLTDFRSRPLLERRAASIHAHTDGDSGPSMKDITNISVKALACLFNQSNGTQVGLVIRALFDSLGLQKGWSKADHCCWLAQKAVGWTRYQYRFAIPVRLVDRLTEAQNDADPQDLHKTLTKMIKAVLTAPTPLANLSTSDLCTNLTALVLRRIVINPHDELLPALVDCLGGAGITYILCRSNTRSRLRDNRTTRQYRSEWSTPKQPDCRT